MKLRIIATCAALLALGACAGTATRPAAEARDAVVASDVPAQGRLRGYVATRRHGDFVIVDGREQRREVEYGWDYERAVALRRTFDLDGRLLETKELSGADLGLTETERARAEALVRGHPALRELVAAPDVLFWVGGFAYRKPGDPYCDRGSRCVHVIPGSDFGNHAVAHAIVDLQTDRVVHPFYRPPEGEPIQHAHGE